MELLKKELTELFSKLDFHKTRAAFEEEFKQKAPRLTEEDYLAHLARILTRTHQKNRRASRKATVDSAEPTLETQHQPKDARVQTSEGFGWVIRVSRTLRGSWRV
jgi:hypothetical protein